jgi:hypothetical protein
MKIIEKKYYLIVYLIFLSNTMLFSQNCSSLDSILSNNKKYLLGKIYQDSLIITAKSKVPDSIILKAFDMLELISMDRFYLIYNCKQNRKKNKLSFSIIEYRKDYNKRLIESYEWTNCPNFYRRYNKAFFKIENGKLIFEKWELE